MYRPADHLCLSFSPISHFLCLSHLYCSFFSSLAQLALKHWNWDWTWLNMAKQKNETNVRTWALLNQAQSASRLAFCIAFHNPGEPRNQEDVKAPVALPPQPTARNRSFISETSRYNQFTNHQSKTVPNAFRPQGKARCADNSSWSWAGSISALSFLKALFSSFFVLILIYDCNFENR